MFRDSVITTIHCVGNQRNKCRKRQQDCKGAQQRKTPEIQRLGYLLDESGQQRLADSLLRVLATRRVRPVLLDPAESATGLEPLDPWRVVPNVAVEPDL